MRTRTFSPDNLKNIFAAADRESLPETPPNYPPIGAWAPVRRSSDIFKAWERSNRLYKAHAPVVYVHVPFCETLCRFCGFYKIPAGSAGAIPSYLKALKKEVSLYSGFFKQTGLRYLCVGGGTPSIMEPGELEEFFKTLRSGFRVTAATKAAFEASPPSLTLEKLRLIKGAGFDWLSLGVQSLDSGLLKSLNRIQTRADVFRSVELARRAGINQVQLDLMVGLPGQSAESFLSDVKTVARLELERVYIFDMQPKHYTALKGGGLDKGGSLKGGALEDARALRRRAMDILMAHGYAMHCGHWVFKRKGNAWPYSYDQGEEGSYSILGLGPSAVSYSIGGARYINAPSENAYEAALSAGRAPIARGHLMDQRDEMINFILLNAINRGQIDSSKFFGRFKKDIKAFFPAQLKRLKAAGLLVESGVLYAVTDRARAVYEFKKEFYRPEIVKRLGAALGFKAGVPSDGRQAPGGAQAGVKNAAACGAALLNLPRAGVCECLLAELTGLEFSRVAGAPGKRSPKETAGELMLAAGKGCKETLLYTGPAPDKRAVLGAVYAARKLGFKTISVLCPVNAARALPPGLLAGAGRLYLAGGWEQKAAFLSAAAKARREGIELCAVLKLEKKNISKTRAGIAALGAGGIKRFILLFPRYFSSGGAPAGGAAAPQLEYDDIRALTRGGGLLKPGGGLDIKFHNVPLCVLFPQWRLAGDYLPDGSGGGDARESGRRGASLKIKACMTCRFLLKCAGPFPDYIEKFGCKDILPVK